MLYQNKIGSIVTASLVAGVLGLTAAPLRAQEEVGEEATAAPVVAPAGYCHMKFPAIQEQTLGTDHPVLQDPQTGEIIDFYGPCDHDPLGKDEVEDQKQTERFLLDQDTGGSD